MLNFSIAKTEKELNELSSKTEIIDFLYEHLDRFGDTKQAISKSLEYCFSTESGKGGFLIVGKDDDELIGVVIMNETAMEDYIPPYILVYVAVRADQRGKGVGAKIIKKALTEAGTDVKLHVEYDNPAKRLYERLGFTTKYAEMRYQKDK